MEKERRGDDAPTPVCSQPPEEAGGAAYSPGTEKSRHMTYVCHERAGSRVVGVEGSTGTSVVGSGAVLAGNGHPRLEEA